MQKKVLVFYIVLALCSCKKMIDVGPGSNMNDSVAFSDDFSAIAATIAVYAKFMETVSVFNGLHTRVTSLYADDLWKPFVSSPLDNPFLNNQLQSNNVTVKEIWNSYYKYIYMTNKVLEQLPLSAGITMNTKKHLEGEARFLRALIYFYLVNTFGDVPLVLVTDPNVTKKLKRSPEKDVYAQIRADLSDAFELLPESYPANNEIPANRIRANKGAAAALQARVYLYTNDYTNAVLKSTWVINCGMYKLEDLETVFIAKSNETILALYPNMPNYNTVEGKIFGGTSTKPAYVLTDALVKSFYEKDNRKASWMRTIQSTAGPVKVPSKYKVSESGQIIEYNVLLRLAEMYLIRAEANVELNNNKDAITDLNFIRKRAGVELLPNDLEASQIMPAIEEENRHEFFTELGHRWFDVRRWPARTNALVLNKKSRADEVLSDKFNNWDPYMRYFPIPRDEIVRSPGLTQNPGY